MVSFFSSALGPKKNLSFQYLGSAKNEREGLSYRTAVSRVSKDTAIAMDQTARMHVGGANRQYTILEEIGRIKDDVRENRQTLAAMNEKLDVRKIINRF